MNKHKFLKNIAWIIILLFSLKLGYSLRSIDYIIIPEPYIILDEHTNVWHGLSLRKTGIPTAWSILGFYIDQSRITGAGGSIEGFNLNVDGKKASLIDYRNFPKPIINITEFDFGRGLSHTRLVQPYIDHPPFGAYVLSLFVNKDVNTFEDVSGRDLRQSSRYLAIITQFLIFLLAFQISKKPMVGIIASMVYATVPSFLLLSRYALLENVLTPLLLISMILALFAKEKMDVTKYHKLILPLLFIAGLFAGLGALTKLVGWIFIVSGAIILYVLKFNLKHIVFYLVPAVVVGSLYFIWGMYLSPQLFFDLFITQGQRDFIGSINLLVTFFRVSIFRFPVDGWWIGGFISLLFIPSVKKYMPIIVMSVAILFSALAVVGSNYPWYFIPLIPFMSISIALVFDQFMNNPKFNTILLVFFTFISSSFYWGYGVFQNHQPFNLYRLLFVASILIAVFWSKVGKDSKYKKIWYFGSILLLIVLFMLNRRSMFFIMENWGKLPLIYTPGTF